MTSAAGARFEVDVATLVKATLALGLLSVFALPILKFIIRPYTHPLRVLNGPKSKHWYWGSWDKATYVNGQFERNFNETIKEYGPVFSLVGLGRKPSLAVCDHRAVSKILLQTPYSRHARANGILRRHVGRGLLTEQGPTHRRQRKIAHPAFTANAVFDMAPVFREKTDRLVTRLHNHIKTLADPSAATHGTKLNIALDLNCVALDIIGSAGFGYEFNALLNTSQESTELERAFASCMHMISTGTLYAALRVAFGEPIVTIGRLLRVKEQAELDKARAVVESVSADLVRRAKKNAEEGDSSSARDVLSLMVRANVAEDVKPTQRLSDLELQQMVPVFMIAGHETTSTATSWACYSMIQGERGLELQTRLREELNSPQAAGWRDDAHVLDALPYLDSFVRETLRFHCPVRQMGREAPFDDVLPLSRPVTLKDGTKTDKIRVKKGDICFLSIVWLNTCEELWGPDGREFKPERWLPEDHPHYERGLQMDPSVKELKGVFSHLLTFGGVSIMEMKYILSALISNFDLLPPNLPGEDAVKIMSVTQIVAHPMIEGEWEKGLAMPVRIRARSA
ncbi:hypothetical protein OC835_000794 [Tilletia horrida]|nr:hypothetical protein OC835_000794 [Tilletia horrida]